MSKYRKQQFDSQSKFSGSLQSSEGREEKIRDTRQASSDSKDFLKEKLRSARNEINILDDHKRKLENYLEEMTFEANNLTSRIQDLEVQLNREKEEFDRLTSKIKKFIKSYNRRMDLEDDLKRSQTRVQKLGEQLSLDLSRTGTIEEDPTIGERAGHHISPNTSLQKLASPSKKRSRVHLEADAMPNQVNPAKDQEISAGNVRLEKNSRWNTKSNSSKKVEVNSTGRELLKALIEEHKSKKSRNSSTDTSMFDKSKMSELGLVLPSTSMAAHAMDEVVDTVETEEKFDGTVGTIVENDKEVAFKIPSLPFPPPPPPVPQNAYAQYKGEDANVDMDGIEEETTEVDIV